MLTKKQLQKAVKFYGDVAKNKTPINYQQLEWLLNNYNQVAVRLHDYNQVEHIGDITAKRPSEFIIDSYDELLTKYLYIEFERTTVNGLSDVQVPIHTHSPYDLAYTNGFGTRVVVDIKNRTSIELPYEINASKITGLTATMKILNADLGIIAVICGDFIYKMDVKNFGKPYWKERNTDATLKTKAYRLTCKYEEQQIDKWPHYMNFPLPNSPNALPPSREEDMPHNA